MVAERLQAYARSTGKCGWCCGVELFEQAGLEARTKLDAVVIGDIEDARLVLPDGPFDVLLLSEVLEHLLIHGLYCEDCGRY